MNNDQFLIWNARGLNSRARRTAVKDVISLKHVSVVSPRNQGGCILCEYD